MLAPYPPRGRPPVTRRTLDRSGLVESRCRPVVAETSPRHGPGTTEVGGMGEQAPDPAPRTPALDAAWARTPPARAARSVLQYGVMVPIIHFIAPTHVVGKGQLQNVRLPAVFVANHQSHADTLVCLTALGGRIRSRLVVAAA